MRKRIENVYGKALSGTLKVVNPIKKSVIRTECEVHLFIQNQSLEILRLNGYHKEYNLFKKYIGQINKGLVWADQDFKSYHHFYNPIHQKGKFGYDENALTVCKRYYNNAIKYFAMENYERGMFYFGAACHIVQDLTIPQHAKGKLLDNHRQFEVYIKSNYNRIQRFKSTENPILLSSIEEYANHNALKALHADYMYNNIKDLKSRFYLIGTKSLILSQRTSAGCMVMFYKDIMRTKNSLQ